MSRWIRSTQNGAMINLETMADIIVRPKGTAHQVLAYTPHGVSITVFEGTEKECANKMSELENYLLPKML